MTTQPVRLRSLQRHAPDPARDAEPWMDGALCAQVDLEIFFPEYGGSARPAKAICARCDVRTECLNFAITNGERFGVWGGMSERERRSLRRGEVRPTVELVCGTPSGASRHYKRGELPCTDCLDAQREQKRHRRRQQRAAS